MARSEASRMVTEKEQALGEEQAVEAVGSVTDRNRRHIAKKSMTTRNRRHVAKKSMTSRKRRHIAKKSMTSRNRRHIAKKSVTGRNRRHIAKKVAGVYKKRVRGNRRRLTG